MSRVTTSCPAWRSTATTVRPSLPDPPVTAIFIVELLLSLLCGGRCRRNEWRRKGPGVSPCVVLGSGLVSGKDLIQPVQRRVVQADVQGAQCGVELLLCSRADDGCRHGGLGKQPCKPDVSWLVAQLGGQVLVLPVSYTHL